jgi:hypothetical protein
MGNKEALKILIFLVLSLMLLSNISATETTIKVLTYPNHNVMVSALSPGSVYSLIQSFHGTADSEGAFSFTLSSDVNEFDLKVWIKNDNAVVLNKRFDGNIAGEPLFITMLPGKEEIIKNYLENNTLNNITSENVSSEANISNFTQNTTLSENISLNESNHSNEVVDQSKGITGLATTDNQGDTGIFSGKIFYFIIGFLVLGVIIFTGVLRMRSRREIGNEEEPKPVNVRKLSDKLKEIKEERKNTNQNDYRKAIEEAEYKIKEAKTEINKLKSVEKIQMLRKKINQDREELDRLEKDHKD